MSSPYHLFEAVGVELEYMIVDRATLDVRPVADKLLLQAALEAGTSFDGDQPTEFEFEGVVWSNELASHVIELKTEEPARTLTGLSAMFDESVERINTLLAPMGCRLLPTGMHPWMDPAREMKLWSHAYSEVYEAFDRIFGCKGHGWANLQSVHINLPFRGDEEFGRLHAAIRLLMPILPALAASSPAMDGRLTGLLDNRLEVYRTNSSKLASMTGRVIPEPLFTHADYDREIFQRIYKDLEPLDPAGELRHEWANARGAIARFSRGSIEIRVLDVQECPRADLAMVALIVRVLQECVAQRWQITAAQMAWSIGRLEPIFLGCVREGEHFEIADREYLAAWGWTHSGSCTAGKLWRHLYDSLRTGFTAEQQDAIRGMLNEGPLARRVLRALGPTPNRQRLHDVYQGLAHCLADGQMFLDSGEASRH